MLSNMVIKSTHDILSIIPEVTRLWTFGMITIGKATSQIKSAWKAAVKTKDARLLILKHMTMVVASAERGTEALHKELR